MLNDVDDEDTDTLIADAVESLFEAANVKVSGNDARFVVKYLGHKIGTGENSVEALLNALRSVEGQQFAPETRAQLLLAAALCEDGTQVLEDMGTLFDWAAEDDVEDDDDDADDSDDDDDDTGGVRLVKE